MIIRPSAFCSCTSFGISQAVSICALTTSISVKHSFATARVATC